MVLLKDTLMELSLMKDAGKENKSICALTDLEKISNRVRWIKLTLILKKKEIDFENKGNA